MNNDRIAEVYNREIFSREGQEIQRCRIHWTCSKVKGEKVLDIGCSQGIVPLLLAQGGFKVIGIDNEKPAIDYAKDLCEKFFSPYKDNVHFELTDFLLYSPESTFDTIILGEILEHLANPAKFLEKVKKTAGKETRIIITTPFGLAPHEDHKTTFTLRTFHNLIKQYFHIEELFVKNKYIYCVCKNDGEAKRITDLDLLKMTDESFLSAENSYITSKEAIKNQLEETSHEIDKKTGELKKKSIALQKQEATYKEVNNKNKIFDAQNKELRVQNEELDNKNKIFDAQNKELRVQNEELDNKNKIFDAQNKKLRDKNAELQQVSKKQKLLDVKLKYYIDEEVARKKTILYKMNQLTIDYFNPIGFHTFLYPFRLFPLFLAKIKKSFTKKENIAAENKETNKEVNVKSFVSKLKDLYQKEINHKLKNETYKPNPKKIVYFLHNSLPYYSRGYASRSHYILRAMNEDYKWDMSAITRFSFPYDMNGRDCVNCKIDDIPLSDKIDGIDYYRLLDKNNLIGVEGATFEKYMSLYAQKAYEKAKEMRPVLFQAASNYMHGLIANEMGKLFNRPSIYEVRGLWQLTRASREPEWKNSSLYKQYTNLEIKCCNEATAVLAITEAIKDYLIDHGADGSKITVIPNGVDSDKFVPLIPDKQLKDSLNLKDKTIIGYIGSFVNYEGLEYLMEAAHKMKELKRINFHFLMVGEGPYWGEVVNVANKFKVNDVVTFTGRVPHEDVNSYYSLIDIAPFPRKGQDVCEIVSPLKPFEAMSMEKCVIASNVRALTEIVSHEKTGLLFQKDNVNELTKALIKAIDNPELRRNLGKNAREWICKEKDWKVILKNVDEVYHQVLKDFNK